MVRRITTAGLFWLVYAAGVLVILASCSGCAAVATTPTPGARCLVNLSGRLVPVEVVGPAYGLMDVRAAAPYPAMVLVSPAALSSCRGRA